MTYLQIAEKAVNEKMEKQEQKVQDIQFKIVEFKAVEGLGESIPQAILQTSIRYNQGSATPWQIFCIFMSWLSTVFASSSMHLQFPYFTSEGSELKNYYGTIKNLVWTLPMVICITTPKLLNFVVLIGNCMKNDRPTSEDIPRVLFLIGTLLLAFLSYSALYRIMYCTKSLRWTP